ncbi:MAG: TolC family protein [Deltaproteobacteria bacterium]|nr:TolC family protein [Deltaproteobacteria bacterium]
MIKSYRKGTASLFALICVSFLNAYAFAEEYTLDNLYRIALEQSEKIKISEENLNLAEINKKKAIAYLNPKLTAYSNYIRFTEEKRAAETNLGLVTLPGSLYQPYEMITWGMRMDYHFSLSGNSITAYNISKINIEKNKFDLRAVKNEYLFAVASAYYNYLKAKKIEEIAQANLERLLKYRNAADKRLKVGEVTKTVLLRAESELSNAQSESVKTMNGVIITKAALTRIVGINRDSLIKETPPEAIDVKSLSYYQDLAVEKRSDIKSLELQKKIAEDQIKYNEGFYWPFLSLAGVYERKEQCPSTATTNRESMYTLVSLNFPFYEGGLRIAEVKETKAKKKQADLLYDDLIKTIMIEIQSTYLELQTQKGILKYLEDQRSYARDNYRAVSRQFDFGLADSIDVLDATTALVSAEMKLAEAAYTFELSLLKMKKVTGVFLESIAADAQPDQ